VHLRTTRAVRDEVPDGRSLLTPPERRRAEAFDDAAAREDFVAAHVLARLAVAGLADCDPAEVELVQSCAPGGGPPRRPRVVGHGGIRVSWSHADGAVAAVAATDPCGIDVEPRGAPLDPVLLPQVLTPRERARVGAAAVPEDEFLRLWMRKEALVKATGHPLDAVLGWDVSRVRGGRLRPRGPGSAASGPGGDRWEAAEQWTATHACLLLTRPGTVVDRA
jgi:4'-phosphopantetheinyl transferase